MTDSLENILGAPSVNAPSQNYSVFEPNQVLDHKQLNSLASYLNYQDHLTRVKLLGVGIVGGLRVSQKNNKVSVSKGVGVTTDGDLLAMPVDTEFSNFKSYGTESPRYAPFYLQDETMRTVFELVRDDLVDATTQPLSALPTSLGEMVVVMLMERYENDPDLCSGTDCDNLGKTAIDTPRLLLVSRGDASALLTVPQTVSQTALKLPPLIAARPAISKSIITTGALAGVYRAACGSIHQTLMNNLGMLNDRLPALIGSLAVTAWTAKLKAHLSAFDDTHVTGIQYYYDFLKDVVDTWNELREVLLADDSLLCPEVAAFPRHLLLGELTNPDEFRTGLFPSPLVNGDREQRGHARFLVHKLDAMINGFTPPSLNDDIRITPSRTEAASLEQRAIPYYYPAEIQPLWNYRLTRRGEATGIYGYRTSGPDSEVFGRQIARYDFFRVEGHLGQEVKSAVAKVEKAIADFNLPFTVRAVLLDNDRTKIVVRPPIRYGDLHRFHHILRKELSLQLSETKAFNERFTTQIEVALQNKTIPDLDAQTKAQSTLVKAAAEQAEPPLAKTTFTEYQQSRQVQDWRGGFKTVVNVANSFKGTLGDVTRTNYATAFDTLLTNNHPAWLEWLESLIQSKDGQEDDKLLFPKFCEQHPGLEHFGGVSRGGTLVLLYDHQARVVADFMLSYRWVETADDEPSEPEQLTAPSYKLPDLFEHSVKVMQPPDMTFDQKLVDFETRIKGTILKEQVESQNRQLDFLKQSVQVLGGKPVAGGGAVDPRRDIGDPLLRSRLEEVESKQRLVVTLRGAVMDPSTSDPVREQLRGELGRVEMELADSIKRSSALLVETGVSLEAGGDGGKALEVISQGMDKITGKPALDALKAIGGSVPPSKLKEVFTLRGF